jgi:hypothetical protein
MVRPLRRQAAGTDTRAGKHPAARLLRATGSSRAAASTAAPKCAATARRVAGEIEPRSAALFFSLWHQEALIMAKHRGQRRRHHPINMNLGIDRIQQTRCRQTSADR